MKKAYLFLIVGIALLVPLALTEGLQSLFLVAEHLAEDFTIELWEHAFIAGLILIAYSAYWFFRKKSSSG